MLMELPTANECAADVVAVTVVMALGVAPVHATGCVSVTVEVAVVSAVIPLVVSGDAGTVVKLKQNSFLPGLEPLQEPLLLPEMIV